MLRDCNGTVPSARAGGIARSLGRVLLISVLASVFLTATGPAGAEDSLPVLASESSNSSMWVSQTFATDGSPVTAELTVFDTSWPLSFGAALYEDNGNMLGSMTFTTVDGRSKESYTDINVIPGHPVHFDEMESPHRGTHRFSFLLNHDTPDWYRYIEVGRFHLVMYAAGNIKRTDWIFRGGAGVDEILWESEDGHQQSARDMGSETFMFTSRDFRGDVNLIASNYEDSPSLTYRGRLQLNTKRDIHINDTLIGSFLSMGSLTDWEMSAETPGGNQSCPCRFSFDDPHEMSGPGDYTFRLTSIDMRADEWAVGGEMLLFGADARLPVRPSGYHEVDD